MTKLFDDAMAALDSDEQHVANCWRTAFASARDGMDAMRDIWPERARSLPTHDLDRASQAAQAFELAYQLLHAMTDSVMGSDYASEAEAVTSAIGWGNGFLVSVPAAAPKA
jgi:hypothetical protein